MKQLLVLLTMAILGAPSLLHAGVQDRLYDFTDAYYTQKGSTPLPSMAAASPAHSR
ncbi:MAG TPA: hypothetical protein VK581_13775 [Chthoniobacterales bacterium]|nr:hypothetical protein [Chthoniobacterales bacterium]